MVRAGDMQYHVIIQKTIHMLSTSKYKVDQVVKPGYIMLHLNDIKWFSMQF